MVWSHTQSNLVHCNQGKDTLTATSVSIKCPIAELYCHHSATAVTIFRYWIDINCCSSYISDFTAATHIHMVKVEVRDIGGVNQATLN